MTRFPLRYAHQNVLVGQGEARAALFRVETVSYPFLAAADKREWLRRLARFAFSVEADFSLYRVCRAYPAEDYARHAERLLDARGQSPAAWRSYLRAHEAHLRELRSFVPEVYLAVSLAGERPPSLVRGADRLRRRVEELFGVAGAVPIPAAEIEALVASEERAFRRAEACLPVRRASTRELQWLLRRAACRGVAEPVLDDHWEPAALVVETADGQPAYEPLGTDLVRHANAPILEHDRALVVDAEEGRSHQAMLGLGALPEESEFPGGAELLFAPLDALAFPVDAVLHARWLGNREAITRVRRRIVDADVAFSEQLNSTHGPLSFTAEENRQLARELDAYLQSHERPPLLNCAISLAVGAAEAGELERRVEALAHRYGTVVPAPAARAAAGAVPGPPAARGRRHGPRLRRRADDRAVRRADADRDPRGRLRAAASTSAARWPAGRGRSGSTSPRPRGRGGRRRSCSPARSGRARRSPPSCSRSRPSGAARWWSTSIPSPITTSRASRNSRIGCT